MVEESSKGNCSSCVRLKEELETFKKEQASTLKMIKEKIISTDKLIKKYQRKCEDFEKQTKILNDVTTKYEESKRNIADLDEKLQASLNITEPQKKNIKRLIQEKFTYEEKILDLKTTINELEGKISTLECTIQGKDNAEFEWKKDQLKHEKKMEKEKERVTKLKEELSKIRSERQKDKAVLKRKAKELSAKLEKCEELKTQVSLLKHDLKSANIKNNNSKMCNWIDEASSKEEPKVLRSGNRPKSLTSDELSIKNIFDEIEQLMLPPLSPVPVVLEECRSSSSDSDNDNEYSDGSSDSLSNLGDALEMELGNVETISSEDDDFQENIGSVENDDGQLSSDKKIKNINIDSELENSDDDAPEQIVCTVRDQKSKNESVDISTKDDTLLCFKANISQIDDEKMSNNDDLFHCFNNTYVDEENTTKDEDGECILGAGEDSLVVSNDNAISNDFAAESTANSKKNGSDLLDISVEKTVLLDPEMKPSPCSNSLCPTSEAVDRSKGVKTPGSFSVGKSLYDDDESLTNCQKENTVDTILSEANDTSINVSTTNYFKELNNFEDESESKNANKRTHSSKIEDTVFSKSHDAHNNDGKFDDSSTAIPENIDMSDGPKQFSSINVTKVENLNNDDISGERNNTSTTLNKNSNTETKDEFEQRNEAKVQEISKSTPNNGDSTKGLNKLANKDQDESFDSTQEQSATDDILTGKDVICFLENKQNEQIVSLKMESSQKTNMIDDKVDLGNSLFPVTKEELIKDNITNVLVSPNKISLPADVTNECSKRDCSEDTQNEILTSNDGQSDPAITSSSILPYKKENESNDIQEQDILSQQKCKWGISDLGSSSALKTVLSSIDKEHTSSHCKSDSLSSQENLSENKLLTTKPNMSTAVLPIALPSKMNSPAVQISIENLNRDQGGNSQCSKLNTVGNMIDRSESTESVPPKNIDQVNDSTKNVDVIKPIECQAVAENVLGENIVNRDKSLDCPAKTSEKITKEQICAVKGNRKIFDCQSKKRLAHTPAPTYDGMGPYLKKAKMLEHPASNAHSNCEIVRSDIERIDTAVDERTTFVKRKAKAYSFGNKRTKNSLSKMTSDIGSPIFCNSDNKSNEAITSNADQCAEECQLEEIQIYDRTTVEEISSKADFNTQKFAYEKKDLEETLGMFCHDVLDTDELNLDDISSNVKLLADEPKTLKPKTDDKTQKHPVTSIAVREQPSISDVLEDCFGVFTGVLPVLEPLSPSPSTMDSDINGETFQDNENLGLTSRMIDSSRKNDSLSGINVKSSVQKDTISPKTFQTDAEKVLKSTNQSNDCTTKKSKKTKSRKKKKKTASVFATRPAFLTELQYSTKALKHLYLNDVNLDELQERLSSKDNLSTSTSFAAALMVFKNKEDFMKVIMDYYNNMKYEHITASASLLSPFEHRVISLLTKLDNVEHLKGLVELVLSYLYKAVLLSYLKPGKRGPDLYSVASYCRIMCGLCRQRGDLSRMRILCYDIIRHLFFRPGCALYLVTSITAVWPAVLSYSNQEDTSRGLQQPLAVTFHVIVSHMSRTANWPMVKNIIGWFSSWKQLPTGITNPNELYVTLLGLMRNPFFAQIIHDKDGFPVLGYGLYENVKSLELVACFQGWHWLNNVLIRDFIWDTLSSWATQGLNSSTKISQDQEFSQRNAVIVSVNTQSVDNIQSKDATIDKTDNKALCQVNENTKNVITEPTVVATIRLLGLVCRLAIQQQQYEIPHVIPMLLGILRNAMHSDKVTFAIQLATAYTLLDVLPWQQANVTSCLRSWKDDQSEVVLPPSLIQGFKSLETTSHVQTQNVEKS